MWDPVILDVECIVCNKTLQKINHNPRKLKMGKIANTNRRSRTPNWSPEEKQYLIELIKQRKEVVVTKSNNGPNHYEEKGIAWNQILAHLSNRFGSKFSVFGSTKKVKTQWQNMKRIAREEIAAHGPNIDKYTKLSLEVCNILDLVKDGILQLENITLNETTATANNLTNIEIKTECLDEDVSVEFSQPGCSGMGNPRNSTANSSMETEEMNEGDNENYNETLIMDSSPSSASEKNNESLDYANKENNGSKQNTSAIAQPQFPQQQNNEAFQRELQQFFSFSLAEKQLKIETLKDERHAARALREMAELKKITAEQKLKHVLWIKKHEMTMYVGEPGSGAGKGGGGGGSIREAGGSFGKMEAAREDQYFYNKQQEQLKDLKSHLDKEIGFHEEQIKRHEDAIRRHKKQVSEIENKK